MANNDSILSKELTGFGLFTGLSDRILDSKKRLTVPSVWRSQVGEPKGFVVMRGFHAPCLYLYPIQMMAKRLARLQESGSITDRTRNEVLSLVGRRSETLTWDSQGRLRISDLLLEGAGIREGKVVMCGALDRLEVWAPDRYAASDEEVDLTERLEASEDFAL